MSTKKQLPLSYSLPPPPPPSVIVPQLSGRGRGRGRGRGYGGGYGRYQPLSWQNNQPLSNQPWRQPNISYTSQFFGGTDTIGAFNSDRIAKKDERLLPDSEGSDLSQSYKKWVESTQNSQNSLKKQNDNTSLMDSNFSKKVSKDKIHQQKKSLEKVRKDTPQEQFKSILNNFERIHDKRKNNDQQINSQSKTEGELNSSLYNKDYEEGFAAAAKAALAVTTALQYKSDDKHDNAQETAVGQFDYQMNNQSELRCGHINQHEKCNCCGLIITNSKKSIGDESRLKPIMDFHLDTPEAIAKWIEQRRKNYPTDANIARKKELEAVHIARGKVLKAQAQKKRSLDQVNGQRVTKKKRLDIGKIDADLNENAGPSGITDLLVAASSAGVSLDVDQTKTIRPLKTMQSGSQINKRLFQKVSSSTLSKKNKTTNKLYGKVCIKYKQGFCPRGKDCANKHTGKMICPPIQRPPDNARCRQRNLRELLLYKEIVEEKNVILQCIRHIVNKNFFGIVTNKAIKNAKKRGEALVVEVEDRQTRTLTGTKMKNNPF